MRTGTDNARESDINLSILDVLYGYFALEFNDWMFSSGYSPMDTLHYMPSTSSLRYNALHWMAIEVATYLEHCIALLSSIKAMLDDARKTSRWAMSSIVIRNLVLEHRWNSHSAFKHANRIRPLERFIRGIY